MPAGAPASSAAAEIAKLRRAMEQIDYSRELTPAEKRVEINSLSARARAEVDAFRARTGEAR